jgi:hypothetical protein
MGSRGDLLALVDGAPGRLATLQGALTTWTYRPLAAIVRERSIELAGDRPEGLAPVAALPAATVWDEGADDFDGDDYFSHDYNHDRDRDRDHDHDHHRHYDHDGDYDYDDEDRDADVYPRTVAPPGSWARPHERVDDGPETLVATYVAVALPDRWRVVGRGHVAVSDGRRSWAGTSTLVTERDSTRAAIHDAGAIGACLYPGALLGGLELGEPVQAEIEGRPCWVVDAHPRPEASGTSLASTAAPHALRLHRDLVGIDHRLWFDTATGILLRHEGVVDGETCSWTALSDLVFGAPLDDGEFRPPPGAVVRSRHELLRDHLSEMGVDPDTVDLDDPVQVRDALRNGG